VSWRDFAPPKSPGRSGHGRGRRCCTGLDASPESNAPANERAENAGNDDVAGVTRGIVKVSQEGERLKAATSGKALVWNGEQIWQSEWQRAVG